MRRGRGGLVRGVARTAVVAGTAATVAGGVHHRQEQKWAAKEGQQQAAYDQQQQMADQQQQIAELQAQQAAAQQPAYGPPPQQAYGPPPQQAYGPPPQAYAPPPQQAYAPPPQEYASPATAPLDAGGGQSAVVEQLQRLAELHTSGILSDEEFAAAKQRVLAGG